MTVDQEFSVAPASLGNCISLDGQYDFTSDRRQMLARARLDLSSGPWLAVDDKHVHFDAGGINFGLGYNAGSLFGVTQFPSVWCNQWKDPALMGLQQAAEDFCSRRPEWQDFLGEAIEPIDKVRTYIASQVLDQFQDTIGQRSANFYQIMQRLLRENPGNRSTELLGAVKTKGQSVMVDLSFPGLSLVSGLLARGVLPGRYDGRCLHLEIPVVASPADLEFLAEQLISSWYDSPTTPLSISVLDRTHYYRFNTHLLSEKAAIARGATGSHYGRCGVLESFLSPDIREEAELVLLDRDVWGAYRERVHELQQAVYEPARQTSLRTFDSLFRDDYGFGILVDIDGHVAGMACAGPIALFPRERGTLQDPQRLDRHVLYPLDLTVAPAYQGVLGTFLKRAMVLLAVSKGHCAFHGRNRDRLAGAMWAINLSLGSYQIRHLQNDYPDSHRFRDCIYYCCPLRWPENCEGILLDEHYCNAELMSRLVNAI
jgi:hypothetical protein